LVWVSSLVWRSLLGYSSSSRRPGHRLSSLDLSLS
jgi:hypothetical protein